MNLKTQTISYYVLIDYLILVDKRSRWHAAEISKVTFVDIIIQNQLIIYLFLSFKFIYEAKSLITLGLQSFTSLIFFLFIYLHIN